MLCDGWSRRLGCQLRAFDIHNHLTFSLNMYDDESYEYPGPSSRRSYPVADGDLKRMGVAWMEAQDRVGIRRALVFDWDSAWVERFCRWFPDRFYGLVVVDPRSTAISIKKVEQSTATGLFLGIKLAPTPDMSIDGRPYRLNDPAAFDFYSYCQSKKLPILFHTGAIYTKSADSRHPTGNLVKFCHPLDLDVIARTFPDLQVIVGHAGRPLWQETLCLANLPNVWIDLTWSQLPIALYEESVRYSLLGFGVDRVMFGSDSTPSWSDKCVTLHAATIDLLRQRGCSESDVARVMYKNAERLFLKGSK